MKYHECGEEFCENLTKVEICRDCHEKKIMRETRELFGSNNKKVEDD